MAVYCPEDSLVPPVKLRSEGGKQNWSYSCLSPLFFLNWGGLELVINDSGPRSREVWYCIKNHMHVLTNFFFDCGPMLKCQPSMYSRLLWPHLGLIFQSDGEISSVASGWIWLEYLSMKSQRWRWSDQDQKSSLISEKEYVLGSGPVQMRLLQCCPGRTEFARFNSLFYHTAVSCWQRVSRQWCSSGCSLRSTPF